MRNYSGVHWQDWPKPLACFDLCWKSTWAPRTSQISARGTCSISGGRFLRLRRSATVPTRCAALASFLILGIAARDCSAEHVSVDLDPAKTQIAFTISATLHTVNGHFRLKEGHFSFDPRTNGMSGDIIVNASSGESGSDARDKRIRHDILEAQRFPEIRLSPATKSGSVAPSGA